MRLNHVGIINRTEEQAVKFYQDFLGLDRIKVSAVPPELSQQLFAVSREIRMLVFGTETVKVEIFIDPEYNPPSPNIPHCALHVTGLPDVLEKAKKAGVPVIRGTHREKTVYFLKDFSGNMIEVMQA